MTDDSFYLDYRDCRATLRKRLAEKAPGLLQILTGPRQVGKTTLLLELQQELGNQAIYFAGDDPNAALPGFWERAWLEAEGRTQHGPAVLMIDEVHHIPEWAGQLKSRWDGLKRRGTRLHVVVSGSSSLRMGAGSRESLAGRFERITLTHWSALSLSDAFGISPAEAAAAAVSLGTYPGAYPFRNDLDRWRAYIRDAILEPMIGRDVLALGVTRRPVLLRQVLAVALGAPAQIVSLQKLQSRVQGAGTIETIAHYLDLLRESYILVGLQKYAALEHRRRAAPPKLVALNNALLRGVEQTAGVTMVYNQQGVKEKEQKTGERQQPKKPEPPSI
jgi:predicted AAA+ superfamily ATPase